MMRRLRVLGPPLLVVGVLLSAHFSGCRLYRNFELRVDDYRLAWRPKRTVDPRVLVVAIDDASIEQEGRWPWSRARMAELVRLVSAARPLAVAFDIVHSEPSDPEHGGTSADEALAAALAVTPRTVLGYFFDVARESAVHERGSVPTYDVLRLRDATALRWLPPQGVAYPRVTRNLPLFEEAAADKGYFNFFPDVDGAIRRIPLALRYGEEVAVPLALATLRQALGVPLGIEVDAAGVRSLRCGQRLLPVDRHGFLRIDFRGPARTFPFVSASDILRGATPPEQLQGKIVLIGVTATAVADVRVTPLSAVYPGVEIHATVIDNILQDRFLWSPRWVDAFKGTSVVAFAALVAVFFAMLRAAAAALASALLVGLYLGSTHWLLLERGCLLPVVGPSLAAGLSLAGAALQRYMWEERERRRLRKALELYLSPSAASYVADRPQALRLGGEKRECTVLFADLRDFTSISETFPAEQLVELLNRYLGAMTEVVFDCEGMLDKYIGDGVMAVWGVPIGDPAHARKACVAALAMRNRLRELCRNWTDRGWPELRMRIGIHSGPVVFGNLGSAEHLSLTVVGDNVNLASRLEGLNKRYGTTILASEETVRLAGQDLLVREIDWVRVKGRQQPVRVFEVLGLGDFPERAERERLARRFEAGLFRYRERDWAGAEKVFAELLQEFPDDPPTAVFFARCREFLLHPPVEEWVPISHVEEK